MTILIHMTAKPNTTAVTTGDVLNCRTTEQLEHLRFVVEQIASQRGYDCCKTAFSAIDAQERRLMS